MKRVRFIAPAKREFLSEVAYYNGKEAGLGTRFAAAVEEATTRALAFPLTGSPASKSTRRVFVKDFPFAVFEALGLGRKPCRLRRAHQTTSCRYRKVQRG